MLEQLLEKAVEREAAISRDSRLSDEGRRLAKAELAQSLIEDMRWLGNERRKSIEIQTRMRALVLDYLERPKDVDPDIAYKREKEIRDDYRARPQQERDLAFMKAAEVRNAEVMRALLTAPGIEPWISEDIHRRGDTVYGRAKNAEIWGRLEDLDVLLDYVGGLADHAALALVSMGADRAGVKEALAITSIVSDEPARG
jgi:hypothetical protein